MRSFNVTSRTTATGLLAAVVALGPAAAAAGTAHAPFTELGGDVGVTSWQAMQEREVVIQNLDHSCGSAAVATVLRYFYDDHVTEKAVLRRINPDYVAAIEARETGDIDTPEVGGAHPDQRARYPGGGDHAAPGDDGVSEADADLAASFAELAQAASAFGYKAVGLAASFDKLRTLKIPAIVHVKYREQYDHFSVLRGVNQHGTVRLGDPSWGKTRLSRHQFLEMWRTRADTKLKGKILLIVPPDTSKAEVRRDFFAAPEPRSIPMRVLAPR